MSSIGIGCKENPGEPGIPSTGRCASATRSTLSAEAALEVPATVTAGAFEQNKAAYSERGDCVFCYICDEPAFAHRYNSDLTVFRQFGTETITGFKVKNVRRICLDDKSINLGCLDDMTIGPDAAPELDISVDAIFLASLKGHRDMPVDVYTIIIRALFRDNREPPKVTVPKKARKAGPQLARLKQLPLLRRQGLTEQIGRPVIAWLFVGRFFGDLLLSSLRRILAPPSSLPRRATASCQQSVPGPAVAGVGWQELLAAPIW